MHLPLLACLNGVCLCPLYSDKIIETVDIKYVFWIIYVFSRGLFLKKRGGKEKKKEQKYQAYLPIYAAEMERIWEQIQPSSKPWFAFCEENTCHIMYRYVSFLWIKQTPPYAAGQKKEKIVCMCRDTDICLLLPFLTARRARVHSRIWHWGTNMCIWMWPCRDRYICLYAHTASGVEYAAHFFSFG